MAINGDEVAHKSEEVSINSCDMSHKENGVERDEHYTDNEKEDRHGNGVDSDYEPARGSLSSHSNEELSRVKRNSRVPKKLAKKESGESYLRPTKVSCNRQEQKLQFRASNNGSKRSQKPAKAASAPKNMDVKKSGETNIEHQLIGAKHCGEVKEVDVEDAPACDQSGGTDDSVADTEEHNLDDDKASTFQNIEEMEVRIEKLEEELMEVAALEISLYSVVPEHGSSAHKVHTPARRLTRLYIHACKHFSQDRRASIAKSIVSGLVLIARSCGNDVSRLTFWLSNVVVLRGLIVQAFGHLSSSNMTRRYPDSNGLKKSASLLQPLKRMNSNGDRQGKMICSLTKIDDWQETSTFISALHRIESWIFSRAVESVWWQSLTPHMQSPNEYLIRGMRNMLRPAINASQQEEFSLNLWKSAFHDAFTRLCPVRAGGHECGCLPVLLRSVMEQCISRLDVAMFNAILRESANEMPSDPVSDPIVDQRVLPVPAGDLSFGSGAMLKNSIGSWSRCLTDWFGLDADILLEDEEKDNKDEEPKSQNTTNSKCFGLLNELSDLLMLPKDMLLEKAIRKEVCPSIDLPLITRILCNFMPDEFCPDSVPGIVLEELNSEALMERRLSDANFPRGASPVEYVFPSLSDMAEKVAEIAGKPSNLERKASMVQRKGYTSDEDLDDLDAPLACVIDRSPASYAIAGDKMELNSLSSVRFKLLREVWCE